MSFIQPLLLFGLPLAALPILIHLIHQHRRRTVKWAAMMFLLMAQRMNKGFSRLRQILILTLRVLAVMALIFLVSRPLAGGWLGLTGGAPDTVLILLDRSASMEQINPLTGMSKRRTGLEKLAAGIKQTYGSRSRLVLLDSALLQTLPLERADALLDLPQTEATDTGADIPGMLQSALDYITANKTGRTDLWLLSDLNQSDWDANGGRWEALRGAYASLRGVRFNLLNYPQPAKENISISVENITRRESSERAELLMDVRISRNEIAPQPVEISLRYVINGASSTEKVTLRDNQLLLQAHAIPLDKSMKRGWGRVELDADSYGPDNVFHFVFDEPSPLRSVIVSEDPAEAEPLRAVLESAVDSARRYTSTVLPVSRAAEIPWDETALLIWHAPLPAADSITARQLENQVAAGRSVLFLPTDNPGDAALFGFHWGAWRTVTDAKPEPVTWWRSDSGLLANTRAGKALPVGEMEVTRRCEIIGEGVPLARVGAGEPLLVRASGTRSGGIYFLGTLPGPGSSSLARDGVVLFAMMHRALGEGGQGLGRTQQRTASKVALGSGDISQWQRVGVKNEKEAASLLPLRAGIVESGDKLVALNRPLSEDTPAVIKNETVDQLFAGLDFRRIEDTLETSKGLTSEVWRTFLMLMAAALLGEALLCLPQQRQAKVEQALGGKPANIFPPTSPTTV